MHEKMPNVMSNFTPSSGCNQKDISTGKDVEQVEPSHVSALWKIGQQVLKGLNKEFAPDFTTRYLSRRFLL
jgi:hypothetical protein